MKVSLLTIEAIKPFITGDGAPTPYMSGPELVKFFNAFGCEDKYSNQGLPNAWSRNEYAYERLIQLNGQSVFKQVIESIPDSRKVSNPVEVANLIGEIIKHDGYSLESNQSGIYKVVGNGLGDSVSIEAHFAKIKHQIIESIKNARFSIWVAVAWFTDKDIGNELRLKHINGVNVRVVVNDDDTTKAYGLKFDSKGIEYAEVSPMTKWGKKLMHNKFCIIDLATVIHGSYNWTSNAAYNNESITITESRELSEEFALQFIELMSQQRK